MSGSMTPILTLGLPVYNAMPYLPTTVESVLGQECGDFKILIVDDGSTDGSYEYLEGVRDSRIRLERQENRGLAATLNRMLTDTDTPWLVRHDADDIAYPNRTKVIMDYIRKHPGAGMFYSMANYVQDNRRFGTFRTTVAPPEVLRNITRAGYLLAICHPAVTLNVKKAVEVGGYRFRHVEDVDLWWRMALHSDLVLIPECSVGVRCHFSSVSSSNLEMQSTDALYVQYLLLSHLWRLEPLPYDRVRETLASMLDRKMLRFRHDIRKANIYAGKGKYFKAIACAAKSILDSPKHFLKRVSYELWNEDVAVNGLDPRKFAELSNELWQHNRSS